MAGCCEHGNEPSGSIKRREHSWSAEELSDSQDELCSGSTGGVRRSLGNPSMNPLGSLDHRRGENGGESDGADPTA